MRHLIDYEVNSQGIWVTIGDSEPIHFNTTQEINKLARDLLIVVTEIADELDNLK